MLSTSIEDRARQQAEDAALMAVRLGLQPQFTPADLADGFDAERLAGVEQAVDDAAEQFGPWPRLALRADAEDLQRRPDDRLPLGEPRARRRDVAVG